MNLLEVTCLSFNYPGEKELFNDLNFKLKPGEIMAVSGISGCGKTTLLYLLAGIIPLHFSGNISGSVNIQGIKHNELTLTELAPHISLVMQNPAQQLFFPEVEQELAFAPENLCLSPAEIENRISNVLKLLDIEELRHSDTSELSYGQQKLTALAAVYTLQPRILLLDEISNGIAGSVRERIVKLIKSYSVRGNCVILADHDAEFISLSDIKLEL